VQVFQGNGFMLRNGGEISNFTTGITPRYWGRTSGCKFWAGGLGCAEALPNAKRTSVIAAKQRKRATKTRSLKNADLEVDFFFMRWSFGSAVTFPETPREISTLFLVF
jgi:hypothetical protein